MPNTGLGNKWGLPRTVYRMLARYHGGTYDPPFSFDDPKSCIFGSRYWFDYPITDYQYQFNSWGFRDQDHEQYQGTEVNICIGDSTTMNLGGPQHHSWCHQLSKYFDIPTLNLGVTGLSCFDVPAMVERARSTYKVRHIFILYNLQTEDTEPIGQPIPTYNHNYNIGHKLSAFSKYSIIPGAHYQFNPPWTFRQQDLEALYRYFPHAHQYLNGVQSQVRSRTRITDLLGHPALQQKYQELAGPSWPGYAEFCQRLLQGHDMPSVFTSRLDQRLVQDYISKDIGPVIYQMALANRDGWHLSEFANNLLARYFRQQALTTN